MEARGEGRAQAPPPGDACCGTDGRRVQRLVRRCEHGGAGGGGFSMFFELTLTTTPFKTPSRVLLSQYALDDSRGWHRGIRGFSGTRCVQWDAVTEYHVVPGTSRKCASTLSFLVRRVCR